MFNAKQEFLKYARNCFSLVFSESSCLVCGGAAGALPLCAPCRARYFSVGKHDGSLCRRCGKQLISEAGLCLECRELDGISALDGVFPLFSYRLWNTEVLCRWKLGGERSFSPFFARLMSERIRQIAALTLSSCTSGRSEEFRKLIVVPVPPRPGKIRRVGWDQVEELAMFLECTYGFSVCRLLRRSSSVEQKSLSRRGRLDTIGKSYRLGKKVGRLPERVCLVDDVLTTGATLEGCAAVLKNAGVEKVYAATLFSVDR